MALEQEPAGRGEVIALERGSELPHTLVLGHDVAQPAAGDVVEAVEIGDVDSVERATPTRSSACSSWARRSA